MISVDILVLTLVGDCVEKLSVCVEVDKTTGDVWPTVCVVECEDGLSVGTEVEIVTTGDVWPIVFVVVVCVDELSAGVEVDDATSVDNWLLVYVVVCDS